MKRHILAGLVLALLTTAIVLLSGPELSGVALLGAALGGALGLVPDRSPAQRAAGFAVGFAAAWLGYALRAAALPDAAAGRAIAVLVVLGLCLAVAALTRGRLPLWSALLGAAAMAGAYEAAYAADPSSFLTSSALTATSILVTAGAGFLATSILGVVVVQDREDERTAEAAAEVPVLAATDPPRGEYEGAGNHAPARPYTRSLDPQPEA